MPDPVERLVNLALFLAAARSPVTAEECRAHVAGYPPDQDDAAFGRMFERDKEDLRATGLALVTTRAGATDAYALDADATFAPPLAFAAEELARLRSVGAALLADPAFPMREELRLALLKVLPGLPSAAATSAGGDAWEPAEREGSIAAELLAAVAARKRASFDYVNARGDRARRGVEPYGLFVHAGGWYLVGRDLARGEPRTFALARASALSVNAAAPKHADFDLPAGFDVRAYLIVPFAYGGARFRAVVRATSGAAPRLRALAQGRGVLTEMPDGALTWETEAADVDALARWTIAHGPGLAILEPRRAAARVRRAAQEVAAAHGA